MGLRIAVGTLFGRVEREKFLLSLSILFCSVHNIVTAWLICLELDKIVALLQLILRVLVDLILHWQAIPYCICYQTIVILLSIPNLAIKVNQGLLIHHLRTLFGNWHLILVVVRADINCRGLNFWVHRHLSCTRMFPLIILFLQIDRRLAQ